MSKRIKLENSQKTVSQVAKGIKITGNQNTLSQVQTKTRDSQMNTSQEPKAVIEYKEKKEPLEIQVKKKDPVSGPKYYKMVNKPRGRVLIINIKTFDGKLESERLGSEKDVEYLDKLFQGMGGYEITIRQNLNANQILETVLEFSQNDFTPMDISVVIIMSHGSDGGRIEGSDSKDIRESDILKMFSEEKAKTLQGKPKVFVFAACRGDTGTDQQLDAQVWAKSNTSTITDFFILRGTAPGHTATRDTINGTNFIRAFCIAMMKHSCDTHMAKLVPIMQDIVKNYRGNQQILLESGLNKKLYFNPI